AAQGKRMEQEAREESQRKESESSATIERLKREAEAYETSRPGLARAEAAAFESRLAAYRENPLVREAGRWAHLLQMVKRLAEAGNLQPLDPSFDSPLPK